MSKFRIEIEPEHTLIFGPVPASIFVSIAKDAEKEHGHTWVSAAVAKAHGATFAFVSPEVAEAAEVHQARVAELERELAKAGAE